MFKPLIAVILALVLVLGGMGKPVYAYSDVKEGYSDVKEGITKVLTNEYVKPVVQDTLTMLTGVAICVGADTLAASVFPPAGVILPYCPTVGGAVARGAREVPVRQVVKTAFSLAR